MKRLLVLLAMVLLSVGPLSAQQGPSAVPIAEVFGGASFYRAPLNHGSDYYGWQAGIDYNVHKNVGVLLDFGGQYRRTGAGAKLSLYEYMVGPRFKFRSNRWTPFVEGLVGGQSQRVPGASRGSFAAGGGGGLDLNLGPIVSIRLFQIDSLHVRDHGLGGWRHDIRAAAGVVLKFPRH